MVGLIATSTSSGIKEMDSNYIELMNKNGNRFPRLLIRKHEIVQ